MQDVRSSELARRGEHILFHRAPAEALTDLRAAADGGPATADAARALWLTGAALGALGRYGEALQVLAPATGSAIPVHGQPRYASLAASSAASIYRQIGRHTDAEAFDERALALAGTAEDAVFDARLGLAADAVGLHRGTDARKRFRAAAAVVPAGSWRHAVRRDWVAVEVALLDGDAGGAVVTARRAVAGSEAAQAPRHVAKSLVFLGASLLGEQRTTGGRADEAAAVLRRAGSLAEGLSALPLVWVARALLGALEGTTDPDGAAASLRTARAAVAGIAAGLSASDRAAWLARPDLAALGVA